MLEVQRTKKRESGGSRGDGDSEELGHIPCKFASQSAAIVDTITNIIGKISATLTNLVGLSLGHSDLTATQLEKIKINNQRKSTHCLTCLELEKAGLMKGVFT